MPLKNDFISLGDIQNVYTRRSITIPAGQIAQIDAVHTFFRLYSTTGNIEVAAQNTGMFEPITAGTWIKNPSDENGNLIKLPYIRIRNIEAFSVTVDIALSNGEVGDDSFIVENTEANPIFVENKRGTSFNLIKETIPANDSYSFTPNGSDIEYLIQNKDLSNSLYLFDAQGIELPAGADFKANIISTFSIYNNNASAVDIVILEVLP